MGRKAEQGQKNLAKCLDNPRYVKVFFTNTNRNISFQIATASYDTIVAGFVRRGWNVIVVDESEQS